MNFKNRLLLFFKGMGMGAADVVPGVSGGTIAFISGIYQELLESIKSVDLAALNLLVRGRLREFWSKINGKFLLPLFGGIIVSVLSLAKLITYLLDEYPILIWAFFFGLIIASAIFIGRQINKWSWKQFLALVVGAAIAFWITIVSPAQMPDNLFYIFIAGAIAICAMILPGISGSFILLLMGAYSIVLGAVSNVTDALGGGEGVSLSQNVIKLLVFMLGCLTGLLSFARILSWFFKNAYNLTLAILTGFMIGSLNKVWPWKLTTSTRLNRHDEIVPFLQENVSPFKYNESLGNEHQLFGAVIFMFVGFALVLGLERLGKGKKIA